MSPERDRIVKVLWAAQEEGIEAASTTVSLHAEEEIGGTVVRVSRTGSLKTGAEQDALAHAKAELEPNSCSPTPIRTEMEAAYQRSGEYKEAAALAAAHAMEQGATPEHAAEVARIAATNAGATFEQAQRAGEEAANLHWRDFEALC